MSNNPTLPAAMDSALRRTLDGVHTHLPGKVVRVNTSGGNVVSVDVQPLIKTRYRDELGAYVVESLPVVPHVPVLFPGAGAYRVTFPVAVGDSVLLAFSEASIDRWLATGNEVDPGDFSRFNLSDAVAILGLRDYAHALTSAPTNRMTLGADSGPQIHIDGSEIRLGSDGATDRVALKSDLDALAAKFSAWVPVANDGGAALKTQLTNLLGTGWPVCSTKVKAV